MRRLILALLMLGIAAHAHAQTVSGDRFRLNGGPCVESSGSAAPTGGNSCDTYKRSDGSYWIKTGGVWVQFTTATGAALTKVDDTNVTLTLGGSPASALVNAANLTLGWTGTLASGRLNSNVVQGITNDTNVTGSIAAQNLTLGWAGTLADARIASAATWNAKLATVTASTPLSGSGTSGSPLVIAESSASTAGSMSAAYWVLVHDATDVSNGGAIVKRDQYGSFSAGTVTGTFAGPLTGNVSGNVTGNVTGNVSTLLVQPSSAADLVLKAWSLDSVAVVPLLTLKRATTPYVALAGGLAVGTGTDPGTGNVDIAYNLTVDTNTLFVDATKNAVGVGAASVSSWASGYPAIQLGYAGALVFRSAVTYVDLQSNAYYDGAGWKYRTTGAAASAYLSNDGVFQVRTAPSGIADAVVTFTNAMRVHNSGGVSIGNTTDPGATNLSATGTIAGSNLSGTNTGDNAANSSTTYVGTTAIALNRASGVMALTGITSIDGTAAALTNTPTGCAAGYFATSIAANGNLGCSTLSISGMVSTAAVDTTSAGAASGRLRIPAASAAWPTDSTNWITAYYSSGPALIPLIGWNTATNYIEMGDGTNEAGVRVRRNLNVVGTLGVTGTTTLATSLGGLLFTTAGVVSTKAIGTDVQAYSAKLADIAALAVTDSNVIVGNGSTWVAESGATARTSLGLAIGSDVQAYNASLAAIAGGTWAGANSITTLGTVTTGSFPAANLSGTTLASGVVTSSLTTVGTLTGGTTSAGFTVALSTSTITGTLADARLSANVPLLNAANNTFTGTISLSTGLALQWPTGTYPGSISANTSNGVVTITAVGGVVTTGALYPSGNFEVGASKFTVAAATGNVVAAGTINGLTIGSGVVTGGAWNAGAVTSSGVITGNGINGFVNSNGIQAAYVMTKTGASANSSQWFNDGTSTALYDVTNARTNLSFANATGAATFAAGVFAGGATGGATIVADTDILIGRHSGSTGNATLYIGPYTNATTYAHSIAYDDATANLLITPRSGYNTVFSSGVSATTGTFSARAAVGGGDLYSSRLSLSHGAAQAGLFIKATDAGRYSPITVYDQNDALVFGVNEANVFTLNGATTIGGTLGVTSTATFSNTARIETTAASQLQFRTTSYAIDAGGLWRWVAAGGLAILQFNTHASSEFLGTANAVKFAYNLSATFGGHVIPVSTETLDLGTDLLKWRTGYLGEMLVSNLVAKNVLSTIGGNLITAPTTLLVADLAAAGTTIHVKHAGVLRNGDRIFMQKANGQKEWISVDSAASGSEPDVSYTISRGLDSSGTGHAWTSGDAVMNSGTTGDGYIDQYSQTAILSSLATVGPTYVGFKRLSSTWNAVAQAWAIGNLYGLYGYGSNNVYGFAAGVYASGSSYVTVDPTNGIRMTANIGGTEYERFHLAADGSGHLATNGISWTTAGVATVGGFTIGATALTAGSGATAIGIDTGGTNPAFYAGNSTPASAPFRVTPEGYLYANTVRIGGNWTASGLQSEDISAIGSGGTTIATNGAAYMIVITAAKSDNTSTINGLTGGEAGRQIVICNQGGYNINFAKEIGSVTAANRLMTWKNVATDGIQTGECATFWFWSSAPLGGGGRWLQMKF